MRKDLPIPPELSHLPVDKRGYPVPYFVTKVKGEWEFRFIDINHIKKIIREELCHICGKPLKGSDVYFISGPRGFQNRASSDAGMHEVCARFSLEACPHLYYQKAERRRNDELGKELNKTPSVIIKEKPNSVLLVKVISWWPEVHGNYLLIRYMPAGKPEEYSYENNILIKK